jgi:hypothetical protein
MSATKLSVLIFRAKREIATDGFVGAPGVDSSPVVFFVVVVDTPQSSF